MKREWAKGGNRGADKCMNGAERRARLPLCNTFFEKFKKRQSRCHTRKQGSGAAYLCGEGDGVELARDVARVQEPTERGPRILPPTDGGAPAAAEAAVEAAAAKAAAVEAPKGQRQLLLAAAAAAAVSVLGRNRVQ